MADTKELQLGGATAGMQVHFVAVWSVSGVRGAGVNEGEVGVGEYVGDRWGQVGSGGGGQWGDRDGMWGVEGRRGVEGWRCGQ